MSLLRAFLASELPASLQDAIHTTTADLRKTLGDDMIRWVPACNIHLTLKFLGDVSPAALDLIKQMLATEASQHEAFDLQIEGLGSYPSSRRPRVLWVGLNAPAALASLQHAIEGGTARLGYESEERGFAPHLTIGRVRQNISAAGLQKIRNTLEGTSVGRIGAARVDAIHLFRSDLQPNGSVYTKLFSAPLGGRP
jgi:RNA 2',3'-cyclic 3'-phosphodiesterase